MIDLMELDINIPSTSFDNYTTMLSAPPKFGKSEFCTKFAKPLIFDFEEGTKGKVTYRVPISKWTETKQYIKQLTSNLELKNKYNTICFDTANYALNAIKQYIVNKAQEENPDKVIDTFNKVGYGNWEQLENEIKNAVNSLKKAGYGVVLNVHIKEKIYNKDLENEYTKTVPDLSDKERNILSSMADFLLLGKFETEIVKKAVKEDKKTIEKAETVTKRVLYLRTSEDTEAGFRWKNVPEKIDFDFDELNRVFLNAVIGEIDEGREKYNLDDSKVKDIREKLDKQKEIEEKKAFEEEKLSKTIEEIISTAKELKRIDRDLIPEIIETIGYGGDATKIDELTEAELVLSNMKKINKK